jgi:hypothetical protein
MTHLVISRSGGLVIDGGITTNDHCRVACVPASPVTKLPDHQITKLPD